MSKVLSLDYGDRRIGVAASDDSALLAFGYGIIENKGDDIVLDELKKIIEENNISKIVVGIPTSLGGKNNNQLQKIKDFIKILQKNLGVEIQEMNEQYTSKMGEHNVRESKSKKEFEKGAIDIEAAKIILQDYLDKNK